MPQLLIDLKRCVPANIAGAACPIAAENVGAKLFHKLVVLEDGHPYSPDYVSQAFAKLLKKYDLPHIRFHELRHSCASLLLNEGFTLKDVQEWMGHANIKMTADIYGHLDAARKKGMADKLSGSLFNAC